MVHLGYRINELRQDERELRKDWNILSVRAARLLGPKKIREKVIALRLPLGPPADWIVARPPAEADADLEVELAGADEEEGL